MGSSCAQAACRQVRLTCGHLETSVGIVGKPPAPLTPPPSSKPIRSEPHEGGHSLRQSSVWVRDGGKLRRSGGTESSHAGKGGEGPAAKFLWKRKGYELSPEAERPAYEKPLSGRNQQVLMALINQEHDAETVGKLMDAWREELGMGSLVGFLCLPCYSFPEVLRNARTVSPFWLLKCSVDEAGGQGLLGTLLAYYRINLL